MGSPSREASKARPGATGTSLLTSQRTLSSAVANWAQGSPAAGNSGAKLRNTPPSDRKIALPEGTSQVRSTTPPKVLARNHTLPCWLRSQNLPSGSNAGFVAIGSAVSQLVHSPVSWLYDLPAN